MPIASQGWAFVSGSNPAGGSSGSIQFNIDGELSGSTDLIWDGSQVLVTGSLSASNKVTALTFHGDGSGLTNVTASAVSVADGPEMSIQFRYDSPIGREISGSSDLMWITGSTDFLQVTGAVKISGDLSVCAGTASIAHLSGCSPITVHSPMSSSQNISASAYYFGPGGRQVISDTTTDMSILSTTTGMFISADGGSLNLAGQEAAGGIKASDALNILNTQTEEESPAVLKLSGSVSGSDGSGRRLYSYIQFGDTPDDGGDPPGLILAAFEAEDGDVFTALNISTSGSGDGARGLDAIEMIASGPNGESALEMSDRQIEFYAQQTKVKGADLESGYIDGAFVVVNGDDDAMFHVSGANGDVFVGGDLSVCAGTASIAHLSGCSDITVHSNLVLPGQSPDGYVTARKFLASGSWAGGNKHGMIKFGDDSDSVLIIRRYESAEERLIIQNDQGPLLLSGSGVGMRLDSPIKVSDDCSFTFQSDATLDIGTSNQGLRTLYTSEVTASGPISASAFYGDGAGITGISLINLDAAGSDTNIQFNQNNEFAASAGLAYDGTGSLTVSGNLGISEYMGLKDGIFQVTHSYGGKLSLGGLGSPYLQTQHFYATSSLAEMEIGPFNKLQIYQDGQISLSSSVNADPMIEMPAGIELVCNPGNGLVSVETNRVAFYHNTASLSSDEQEYLWSINSDHTEGDDDSAWIKLDMDSKEFVVGAADNIKLVAQDIAASSLTASGRVTSNDIRTAGDTIYMGGDIFGMGKSIDGFLLIHSKSTHVGGPNYAQSGIHVVGGSFPADDSDQSVIIDVDGIGVRSSGSLNVHTDFNYYGVSSGTPDGASSFLAVQSGKVIKSAISPGGSDGQLLFNQNGVIGANSQYTVDGSGSMTIGSGGGTLFVRNILDVPQISSSFAPGDNGQGWKLGFGDGSETGGDSGGALSMFTSTSAGVTTGYLSVFTADSSSYTDGGGSNNYTRVQINNAMRLNGDLQVGSINNHESASLSGVNWKLSSVNSRALAFFTGSSGDGPDYLVFSGSATDPAVKIGVPLRFPNGVAAGTIKNPNSYLALNSSNEVISTSSAGGGGSVAGSNKQVQFNQNGAFGANSNFTYNGSGSLELGSALHINGASDLTVNNITYNGSNDQAWTLRDGIDGSGGPGKNGAMMFLTGASGDFMRFHTSGSAKGIYFPQQTYLSKGSSMSGTLAGPGSFLALDSDNMVVLATPSGGGGGGATVFTETDGSNAYSTSSISVGTTLAGNGTLFVSGSGGASGNPLFRVAGDDSVNLLVVTGSGRVGIGTAVPQSQFHISGTIANEAIFRIDAGTEAPLTGGCILYVSASAAGGATTGPGMVGIGTDTPNTNLTVRGHISVGTDQGGGYIMNRIATNTRLAFGEDGQNSLALKANQWPGVVVDNDPTGYKFITLGNAGSDTIHVSGGLTASSGLYISSGLSLRTTSPSIPLDVHYTGSGDPTNLDTDKGGGEVVYFGSGSTTAGKLYYLNTDGGWAEAVANVTGSGHNQLLGIAIGNKVATKGMLLKGYFNANSYYADAFIKGGPVYISTDSGFMSGAAPTGSDEFMRIVGYGTDTGNVVYFNPDSTYIELS